MKLYFSPGSCSLAPHIVLREAEVAFDLEYVDVKSRKLADGADYLEINPRGYVPVLALDDGSLLTEGPAIVQYIADLRPETGLAPAAGTMERVRLQEWLSFIHSELHHSGFAPLFNRSANDAFKDDTRKKLGLRLSWVEGQMVGRSYLLGECFTVADAYLFAALGWARYADIDIDAWPVLAAYQQRVGARPRVKEAVCAELQEVMLRTE